MKKSGTLLVGIIIGAILTYFFCPRQEATYSAETMTIPKDTITLVQAKILSDNWANHNPIEVDSLTEVEGSNLKTRSVWWSLDEVNDYLVYAKAKSDTLGYKMTGVRVYLGNYGSNAPSPNKNRNTMFIVPTGVRSVSQASSLNSFLPPEDDDIPVPPLNKGDGGSTGYPN